MIKKIFLILIFFFIGNNFGYLAYGETIKIEYKVNEDLITNYDIYKEAKYLKGLNKDLVNIDENQLMEFAKNSLIKEKIKYDDFKKLLNNYSGYQDDLNGDEVGIPLYFLGKSARSKGVTVVQVGEGADELFYGYEHWLKFIRLNKLVKPIRNTTSKFSRFSSHRLNLLSNIIYGRTSFAGGALGFNLTEINKLVEGGVPNNSESLNYVDRKWDEYFSRDDAELSKWMTLIDLDIRLPELLLMRMDKLVMQSGIETRVPFLDHEFVEFVLTIPEKILLNKK